MSSKNKCQLIVLTRQKPHVVGFFILSVVIGLSPLVGAPRSASAALLPEVVYWVWLVLFGSSGLVGLLGYWWPGDRVTGMRLETGALLIQAGSVVLYGAAIAAVAGARAMAVLGMVAVWAGCNIWEAVLLRRDAKMIEETAL